MVKKTRAFRANDIRGIYPVEINAEIARTIGRVVGNKLPGRIAIGLDVRSSSPVLYEALKEGLALSGVIEVIEVGIVTTPTLYYLVSSLGLACGVMVTASHSPAEHGGLKIMREGAAPVSGEEVWRWIEEDGLGLYADFLRGEIIKGGRVIKVVFDCSNGSAGRVLRKVFLKNHAIEAIFINDKEDANFTAHGPDPLGEGAIEELKARVVTEVADLGVIFDADGDRAFFVDENGEEITSAQALTLMGMSLPEGERVVIDQIIGGLPKRVLGDWGIEVVESRVGNIFVREKMREVDAVLGGEYSGHFYFRNFGFNDSGIFAAIQLINILKSRCESASELLNSWPRFYAKMVNFEFDKGDVPQVIERIIAECGFAAREINREDGVKLIFDDYFIAVRASNTEDLLRLNVEAVSEEILEEVLERVGNIFKDLDI